MKKLFLFIAIVATFSAVNANAKTEGMYLGINAIKTEVEYDGNEYQLTDSKESVGIDLKYAFSFDNFFIAPKAFFDFSNNELSATSTINTISVDGTIDVKSRLGFGVDFGYDFNDNFALFANASVVSTFYNYKLEVPAVGLSEETENTYNIAPSYSLGATYSINDQFSVNLSYEISSFTVEYRNEYISPVDDQDFDINTVKLGAAYRF